MLALDIVIEILSRLPPESLLRFKSVNKSWNALIDDPTFISKHLSISLQQKHLLLENRFLGIRIDDSAEIKKFPYSILKFPLHRSVSVQDVHFAFDVHRSLTLNDDTLAPDDDRVFLPMVNHSHGLVCLGGSADDLFLCNMATRQFRKLPPSIIYLDVMEHNSEDIYLRKYFSSSIEGFGYDAKSRDFKVVRVLEFLTMGPDSSPPRVEIYDLSKDRWREIDSSGAGFVPSSSLCDTYHEGKFYWWAYYNFKLPSDNSRFIIQTFDISEEVFGQISYPETMKWSVDRSRQSLRILNGSVVLIDYPFRGDEKTFDIWKMEKDEFGAILWSKQLTFGPVSKIEYPLLFVSTNELLVEGKERELILYDIKTGEYEELPIKGHLKYRGTNSLKASFLVKSLLSVQGGKTINFEF